MPIWARPYAPEQGRVAALSTGAGGTDSSRPGRQIWGLTTESSGGPSLPGPTVSSTSTERIRATYQHLVTRELLEADPVLVDTEMFQ